VEGKVVKVSFNLAPEVVDVLKDLASKRGMTVTDVLRRAIGTEKFVQNEIDKGGKILVEEKDKSIKQVVFR
jgi:predicted DNA-binding protein